MRALELRIPPPVVTAVIAAAMWGLSLVTPSAEVHGRTHAVIATVLAVIGFVVSIAGVLAFRRARTTVNPMKPATTSALVSSGIYRMSRNPMYLGILLALTGWAAYLANVWTLAGPLAFVLYINRFQITPEERALTTLFGSTYTEYCTAVRRWL